MALGPPLIALLALVSFVFVACSGSTSPEPTLQPQATTEATSVPATPTAEATVVPAETRGPAPTISAPLAATVVPTVVVTSIPPTFTPAPTPTVQPPATQPAAQCTISGPPADVGMVNLDAHLPNTYRLVSVDVGSYNLSYSGYEPWRRDFDRIIHTPGGSGDELTELYQHVFRQVYAAITDRGSEIGYTMRALEQACNSVQSGLGIQVWWDYLFGPMLNPFSFTPLAQEGGEKHFIQTAVNYRGELISHPDLSFGDYLDAIGYTEMFEDRISTAQSPTPAPSRPTQVPPQNNTPVDGRILYDRPLSEWRNEQWQNGWTEATSTSLHIGVFATDERHIIESWTDSQDFANISASVEVREVSNGTAAMACLSVRHDISSGDYSLCIHGDGSTRAIYNYVDANGVWQVEELLGYASRGGTGVAAGDTLEIVADGNLLTFKVNGMVHGTVTHNARTIGGVALAVRSVDAVQDAEFEFRNLVVRDAR